MLFRTHCFVVVVAVVSVAADVVSSIVVVIVVVVSVVAVVVSVIIVVVDVLAVVVSVVAVIIVIVVRVVAVVVVVVLFNLQFSLLLLSVTRGRKRERRREGKEPVLRTSHNTYNFVLCSYLVHECFIIIIIRFFLSPAVTIYPKVLMSAVIYRHHLLHHERCM